MDPHSYKVLEFGRIKNIIAGFAVSERGRDYVLALDPYDNLPALKSRLKEVSEAVLLEDEGESIPLKDTGDISEQLFRAEKGGILPGEDLKKIQVLLEISGILSRFFSIRKDLAPALSRYAHGLYKDPRLLKDLRNCLDDDGKILNNASAALAVLRRNMKKFDEKIRQRLEKLFHSSAYHGMLQEPLITSREGRWVVPVRSEYRSQFPGLLIDRSSSGATVFMEPWLVVDLGNQLREARIEEKQEEEKIRARLSEAVGQAAGELENNLEVISHLDLIAALSKFARNFNAVIPQINTHGHLKLVGARHPLLTVTPVPVDIELGADYHTLVLTGPNTGGKTVTLKVVGLFCLMALSGIPIPAERKSTVPVFSRVFADIGDEQSIQQNLSTFSSHITQLIRFLERADENTLVLIDELGAGTDPVEGTALGMAILEHLHHRGSRTLVSTHYGEIKSFAAHYPGVQNAAMEFDEETLQPLFKVKIGVPGRSCAFEVAHRLGMGEELLLRARDFMKAEHIALEELVKNVEREEEALKQELKKVEELRREHGETLEMLEIETERMQKKAAGEMRDMIGEARRELNKISAELRHTAAAGGKKPTRRQVKEAEESARTRMSLVIERLVKKAGIKEEEKEPLPDIGAGDLVEIISLKQRGTVTGFDRDGRIAVRVGSIRMWFDPGDLVKLDAPGEGEEEFGDLRREKILTIKPELNLRGQRLEEAMESLAKYIDDAILAGMSTIRIVHGKGHGILKKAVGEYLENNPHVADYHLADVSQGSWGATVVNLK